MNRTLKRLVAAALSFSFIFQQTGFAQVAPQIQPPLYLSRIALPADALRPDLVRGLSVDEKGAANLLLVPGNGREMAVEQIASQQKTFSQYVSIGLALPDASFWVNLRPDSPDKVIDPLLAQTDIGKVLLEADVQLKKDLASLTNPSTPEGTQYWNKLYQRAEQLFPSESVEIPTFNRPWIVPGEVILKENDNGVLIFKANLRVMLEQDHLQFGDELVYSGSSDPRFAQLNDYSSRLIREYILPRLTVIVNSSKRYAQLRQVFNALILAQWLKSRVRQHNKTEDITSFGLESKNLDAVRSTQEWQPQSYFDRYCSSFKNGEYNKEEAVSTPSGITVRRYFSGGINFSGVPNHDGGRLTRWSATVLMGGLSVVMLRSFIQAVYEGEPGTAALTAAAGLTSVAAAGVIHQKMGRDGGVGKLPSHQVTMSPVEKYDGRQRAVILQKAHMLLANGLLSSSALLNLFVAWEVYQSHVYSHVQMSTGTAAVQLCMFMWGSVITAYSLFVMAKILSGDKRFTDPRYDDIHPGFSLGTVFLGLGWLALAAGEAIYGGVWPSAYLPGIAETYLFSAMLGIIAGVGVLFIVVMDYDRVDELINKDFGQSTLDDFKQSKDGGIIAKLSTRWYERQLKSFDREKVNQAIAKLAGLGKISVLLGFAGRTPGDTGLNAFNASLAIDRRQTLDYFLDITKDAYDSRRIRAIDLLGRTDEPSVVSALIDLITSGTPKEVCIAAIDALGKSKAEVAVKTLVYLLEDQYLDIRVAAVKALGSIASKEGVDPLLEVLKGDSWGLQGAAITALAQIGDQRATSHLIPFLKHSDKGIIEITIRALGALKDPASIEALKPLTAADNFTLSRAAYGAMGKIGGKEAAEFLGNALPNETHWQERRVVAEALGNTRHPAALKPLMEAFTNRDEKVHKYGYYEDEIRDDFAEALGKIGSKEAVQLLADALLNEYYGKYTSVLVRKAAAKALGEIGDRSALPALYAAGREDPQSGVRKAVDDAIVKIARPSVDGGNPVISFIEQVNNARESFRIDDKRYGEYRHLNALLNAVEAVSRDAAVPTLESLEALKELSLSASDEVVALFNQSVPLGTQINDGLSLVEGDNIIRFANSTGIFIDNLIDALYPQAGLNKDGGLEQLSDAALAMDLEIARQSVENADIKIKFLTQQKEKQTDINKRNEYSMQKQAAEAFKIKNLLRLEDLQEELKRRGMEQSLPSGNSDKDGGVNKAYLGGAALVFGIAAASFALTFSSLQNNWLSVISIGLSSAIVGIGSWMAMEAFGFGKTEKERQTTLAEFDRNKDGGINKVRTTRLLKVRMSKDASDDEIKNMLNYSLDYLHWLKQAKDGQEMFQRILILMLLDAQLEHDYNTADLIQSLPDLWDLMNKDEKTLLKIAQNPKSPVQVDALIIFAMKADPKTVARKLAMTKARFTARKDTYMRTLTEKVIEAVQEQDKDGGSPQGRRVESVNDGGKVGLKPGQHVSFSSAIERLNALLKQNGHTELPDEQLLNLQGYFARQERKAVPVEKEDGPRDLYPGDLLFYSDKAGAHQAVCLKSEDLKVDYLQFNFPPIPVEMQAVVVENIPLEELPDIKVFSPRDGGQKAMGVRLIGFLEARRGIAQDQIENQLKPVLRSYLASLPGGLTPVIEKEIDDDPIGVSLDMDLAGAEQDYRQALAGVLGEKSGRHRIEPLRKTGIAADDKSGPNLRKTGAVALLLLALGGIFFGLAGHLGYDSIERSVILGDQNGSSDFGFILEHGINKNRVDIMRQVTDDAVSDRWGTEQVSDLRDDLIKIAQDDGTGVQERVEAVNDLGRIYRYLVPQVEKFSAEYDRVVNSNSRGSDKLIDTELFKTVYSEISDALLDIAYDTDNPVEVRIAALQQLGPALAASQDDLIKSHLEDLADYDADEAVQQAARQALGSNNDGGVKVSRQLLQELSDNDAAYDKFFNMALANGWLKLRLIGTRVVNPVEIRNLVGQIAAAMDKGKVEQFDSRYLYKRIGGVLLCDGNVFLIDTAHALLAYSQYLAGQEQMNAKDGGRITSVDGLKKELKVLASEIVQSQELIRDRSENLIGTEGKDQAMLQGEIEESQHYILTRLMDMQGAITESKEDKIWPADDAALQKFESSLAKALEQSVAIYWMRGATMLWETPALNQPGEGDEEIRKVRKESGRKELDKMIRQSDALLFDVLEQSGMISAELMAGLVDEFAGEKGKYGIVAIYTEAMVKEALDRAIAKVRSRGSMFDPMRFAQYGFDSEEVYLMDKYCVFLQDATMASNLDGGAINREKLVAGLNSIVLPSGTISAVEFTDAVDVDPVKVNITGTEVIEGRHVGDMIPTTHRHTFVIQINPQAGLKEAVDALLADRNLFSVEEQPWDPPAMARNLQLRREAAGKLAGLRYDGGSRDALSVKVVLLKRLNVPPEEIYGQIERHLELKNPVVLEMLVDEAQVMGVSVKDAEELARWYEQLEKMARVSEKADSLGSVFDLTLDVPAGQQKQQLQQLIGELYISTVNAPSNAELLNRYTELARDEQASPESLAAAEERLSRMLREVDYFEQQMVIMTVLQQVRARMNKDGGSLERRRGAEPISDGGSAEARRGAEPMSDGGRVDEMAGVLETSVDVDEFTRACGELRVYVHNNNPAEMKLHYMAKAAARATDADPAIREQVLSVMADYAAFVNEMLDYYLVFDTGNRDLAVRVAELMDKLAADENMPVKQRIEAIKVLERFNYPVSDTLSKIIADGLLDQAAVPQELFQEAVTALSSILRARFEKRGHQSSFRSYARWFEDCASDLTDAMKEVKAINGQNADRVRLLLASLKGVSFPWFVSMADRLIADTMAGTTDVEAKQLAAVFQVMNELEASAVQDNWSGSQETDKESRQKFLETFAAPGKAGGDSQKQMRIKNLRNVAGLLNQIYGNEKVHIKITDGEGSEIVIVPTPGQKEFIIPLSADPSAVLRLAMQFESEPWKRQAMEFYLNDLQKEEEGLAAGTMNSYADGGKADLSTASPGLAVNNLGGVDFRATLAGAQVNPANTPEITAAMVSQIAKQAAFQVKDLAAVQKQLLSRISQAQSCQDLPVQEVKECLAVCAANPQTGTDTAEQIAVCLLNILQQEEERGLESSAQLKELLGFAESCQA